MSMPEDSDAHWMGLALAQAHEAAVAGEVPVGAVVVKDGALIASGRNAPIAGHDPTAHAEIVALREAARVLGNYRLDGCSLYVTLEPCPMCSGAMLHARLDRVVYGAADPRTGAAGSVVNLFAQSALNHQTQVQGGVLAEACGDMLKAFFKPRRINTNPLREDALRTPDSAFAALAPMPGQWLEWTDLHVSGADTQGLRLCALDTGPNDELRATLWIHGPQGWSQGWHSAVQASPMERHLVPDLLGFGRSDKPKKEAFHQPAVHAQVLHALCNKLSLVQVQLQGTHDNQALLLALQALQPERYSLLPAMAQTWANPALQDAPYPDKGYRAGPRALTRLWVREPADH